MGVWNSKFDSLFPCKPLWWGRCSRMRSAIAGQTRLKSEINPKNVIFCKFRSGELRNDFLGPRTSGKNPKREGSCHAPSYPRDADTGPRITSDPKLTLLA
uniref:Uncharacterized protein n=1 Tax=Solanum tuberosum TaxID=4113 RepID=M0ZR20_SOLTU